MFRRIRTTAREYVDLICNQAQKLLYEYKNSGENKNVEIDQPYGSQKVDALFL